MVRRSWPFVALLVASGAQPVLAQEKPHAAGAKAPDVTALVRGMIEPAYRKNSGLGFKSFVCPAARPPAPGGFLDCDAVDDEGDALRYTLKIDAAGDAAVVLVTQPASAIPAKDKAALEPPCRAFLTAYAAGDWKAVYATFHPDLRRTISREQMRARLEPVRQSLGALRSVELRSYSRRLPDQHELQYALACARGGGMARYRIDASGDGTRITAFMVTGEPGSPALSAMLEPALRTMLSSIIGKPVERLEAQLDRLVTVGDAVPATAYLPGGQEVAVRLVQSGRPDDFDPIDFSAELLDAPLLIERFFKGRGAAIQSIDCPSRVVADGGRQTCRVTLSGGRRVAITLARRGGEHRLTEETLQK